MHTHKPVVIHRDLKPLNVMVSRSSNELLYTLHSIFQGTDIFTETVKFSGLLQAKCHWRHVI